jgi:homoserine O-acetyltransferase
LLILAALAWGSQAFAAEEAQRPQQFAEFDECRLASGEVIAPCRIGYRTYGALNADRSNAILVPTWFTGTSEGHAFLVSPQLLDPQTYFVVIVDALANGVSSSPSNSMSQPGEQFPEITIGDMVKSQQRLLTEVLDIDSLYAVVGLSMGGMQAFEWAVQYPDFAAKAVAAIGSPRLPSYDIALWTTRNRLLALYRECRCEDALEAIAGVGMLTAVPTKLSQDTPREDTVASIEERGASYPMSIAETWDVQRQAEAMISHNIARDYDNDLEKAAAVIKAPFLIIVGEDDRVVTPGPALQFAPLIDAKVVVMDEDCGHGDPWCAPDKFADAVSRFIIGR